MAKMNRIEWLDYMKGVAILIVVIGHVSMAIGEDFSFTRPIIVCEMPLFFMLSGILATKIMNRSILESYRRKFVALWTPFVVVGTTYALCTGAMWWYLFDMYHLAFWFLLSLLSCWLIFIPSLKLIRKILSPYPRFISAIGELGLFLPFVIYKMVSSQIPENVDATLSLNFTFTYYRFFVVGYFVGVYYHKLKNNFLLGICVILTMSLLIMSLNDSWLLEYIPMTFQQLILSVCLSATIYVCYRFSCPFYRKLLTRYGRASLNIFVFHVIVVPYISLSFLRGHGKLLAFGGTLVVSVFLCESILILSYPIEHNRYLRKYILGKS